MQYSHLLHKVGASSNMHQKAELELIQSGNITANDLHAAKESSRNNHESVLLNILKGRSVMECEAIAEVLARHYKTPFLSLDKTTPPHHLMEVCSAKVARKLHFLPITELDNKVVIGMVDPLDLRYHDEVRAIFQKNIKPVFISLNDFERNYHRFFRKGMPSLIENTKLMNTKALTHAFLNTQQRQSSIDPKPMMTKKFASTIIRQALAHQANGFSIEPQQDLCLVNLFHDGKVTTLFRFSMSNHQTMLEAMMQFAKLNPSQTIDTDQFSRCKLNYKGNEYILCYRFHQTPTGERVVVQILNPNATKLTIEDFGFSHEEIATLKETLKHPGMIVVTGSGGSGKSTLLQAMARYAKTLHKNIFTIEDIIGLRIDGVRQFQVKPQGPSKAKLLKSMQSDHANVIVIDSVDAKTLPSVLDAVENGCLVLLSLNAKNISRSISKLLCSGISRSRLASALKLVCTHKMVRKLCNECKSAEALHASTMTHWQIPERLQFYNGNGCDTCSHTGYAGSLNLSEMLIFNSTISDLINQGASGPEIFQAGRENGMLTLIEQGMNKALSGQTSLSEILATVPYHEVFSVNERMRMMRIMPLNKLSSNAEENKHHIFTPKTPTKPEEKIINHAIKEEAPLKSPTIQAPPIKQDSENLHKARVLLVDDSPVTLKFTSHILKESNYFHVDVAETAAQALEMLQSKQYHLVITDQEMPGQTGQEFIETIREHGAFSHVGTILLTGNLDEMMALKGGADGYIAKPTDPELLVARAKSISDIYKRLSDMADSKTRNKTTTADNSKQVEFTKEDLARISSLELDMNNGNTTKAKPMVEPKETPKSVHEFEKLFK